MKLFIMKYMENTESKKTEIITLGQNCMPRAILTRRGIKKRKIFGEVTYPFDLAVFETREITHSIKTDFKEFLYNLKFVPERNIWIKAPDCIEFVHETKFKANDKEKLIKKYSERIENFRKVIESPNPVIFVQILGDCSDIENLYSGLKKIRGERIFRFVVIDTQNITIPVEGIDILKQPFPSEEYKKNWWKKEYYSSSEGVAFEEKIADFVKEIIHNMN